MKRLLGAMAAALVIAIVAPAAQPSGPAAPYTVVTKTGRQPLGARIMNGQEMFALDDLARLFNLQIKEDALAGGLTVTAGTQTIVLSQQQPLASINGRLISLPAPATRDGRTWYVPVDFVSRALAPALGARLELRKPTRLLIMGDVRMPRLAARVEPLGSLTRVTIDVAPATPHTVTQEAGRLIVHFDADALDAGELKANATTDTLANIHTGDTPQNVAIDLGPRFGSFRAADQPAPNGAARIVIDLTEAPLAPAAPGQPQPTPPQPQPTAPEAPPLLDLPPAGGLRTIVIDAGHGGDDAGVKGAGGTLEKNVTLSVARRLKASLEARLGVRVLLTRDGDQTVSPDQRAALANNNKADLFISLHANASLRQGVTGAQVYYLTLAGYGDDVQNAPRGSAEALPVVGGGSREIEVIPWETAQLRYLQQSAAFAAAIEGALREHVPMNAHPVMQGPMRVLLGANMPAVLVELGFLSNATQEHELASDQFQANAVQALTDGIVRYRAGVPATPGVK